MESAGARPIRLGCFDVRNGSVVVADESLPIAVEADAVSGAVIRIFTWPLSPGHRGRPTALDILGLDKSIVISSPAAGGIVEIDRHSGEAAIIPLDADVGTLIPSGDAVWAVAGPDWAQNADGPQLAGPRDGVRPVVWEEPTGEAITRFQEKTRHLHFPGAAPDSDDDGQITIADWRDAEGDDEDLEPPTPLWRVRAGTASRIEVDLVQPILTAAGSGIVGVGRLPTDPIIKHLTLDGSLSWRYPGTVIMIDEAGTLEVVGAVPGSGGVVCADHGRVWLLGFDQETDGDPAPEAREVLLGEGRVAAALDVRLHKPVAVLDQFVVDIGSPEPRRDSGDRGTRDREAPGAAVVQFLPIGGGHSSEAGPADLTSHAQAKTSGGEVWLGDRGACVLRVAAPGKPGVRGLAITVDCRPWAPQPQLPAGFDSEQFEEAQLDYFRGSFLGGSRTQDGEAGPFIEGVSFDAVELGGEFPDRQVLALFHARDRPGIQFGRCWGLYDELGNPIGHEYADIGLMEDVEAAGGGLPPPGSCVPDADGVVWF